MTREEEIMQEANTRYSVSHPFIDIAKESFIESAQWADKTMIEKACEWLNMNIIDYITEGSREGMSLENQKILIEDFRKAMEE